MARQLPTLTIALFTLFSGASFAQADVVGEPAAGPPVRIVTAELVEAHHAYKLARLRLQQYRQVIGTTAAPRA